MTENDAKPGDAPERVPDDVRKDGEETRVPDDGTIYELPPPRSQGAEGPRPRSNGVSFDPSESPRPSNAAPAASPTPAHTPTPQTINIGDIVRAADRENYGIVIAKYQEQCLVYFKNPDTQKQGTILLDVAALTVVHSALQTSKRRILSLAELDALTDPPWTVKWLFRLGELGAIYGPSSAGKTFLVFDLVLRVAAGLPWFGRRVSKGKVLYVAGEGAPGIRKRLQAWRSRYSTPEIESAIARNFVVADAAVHLLNEVDFGAFVVDLHAMVDKPHVVVLDTMARALVGGDENSAKDVGAFIAKCDVIRAVTGATVLLVHHTGKKGDSERGSSALRGACDLMLSLSKADGGADVVISCEKLKDGEPFGVLRGKLETVTLGLDEDGDPMTSCAFVQIDTPRTPLETIQTTLKRDCSTILTTLRSRFLADGCPTELLRKASGLSSRRYYACLEPLAERGCIERVKDGRSKLVKLVPHKLEDDFQ